MDCQRRLKNKIKKFFSKFKIITQKTIENNLTEEELAQLRETYDWCNNDREIIFCILDNIKERPICELERCTKTKRFDRNGYLCGCCGDHKRKITNLKKFGTEHNWAKGTSSRKKFEETMQEKYGATSTLASEELKEKVKATVQEKYNVDNVFQSEEIKEKIKRTNLEKYGVENPQQNKEIKKKSVETYNQNFEKIDAKRKATMMEKYGVLNINQIGKQKWFAFTQEDDEILKSTLENKSILELEQEFNVSHFPIRQLHHKIFGKTKQMRLETSLFKFIEKILPGTEIITNTRKVITPLELDLFILSKNFAIEFNGNHWHTEKQGKNWFYHLNKTLECEKKGIFLMHVSDKEWLFKQKIIKSLIKDYLGLNEKLTITTIREIDSETKNKFLEENSITDERTEGRTFGAFANNELVGILTISENEILELCVGINISSKEVISAMFEFVVDELKLDYVEISLDRKFFNVDYLLFLRFELVASELPLLREIDENKIWDCGKLKLSWNLLNK